MALVNLRIVTDTIRIRSPFGLTVNADAKKAVHNYELPFFNAIYWLKSSLLGFPPSPLWDSLRTGSLE